MTEYTILIAAYNEAAVIGNVLNSLGKPECCREIIVIDDGSLDRTAEVAAAHGPRVVRHSFNKGYGAALKTGIWEAKTDYVICCDADGQHRPEDVVNVAKAADNYDMVVGARDRESHRDWLRRPGKAVLGWFANMLTGREIPDVNSGLRSFRVATIKKYLHLMPAGFSLSTTSSIAMLRMGYAVHYVAINVQPRTGRKSTVQVFRDGFRVFMLIVNLTVLFNPMRVFIPLSFVFMLASFVYFIGYSITERVHITESMVALFITGVLVFCVGIVCEQVSAIRREMHS